jgi:hypothetical protein
MNLSNIIARALSGVLIVVVLGLQLWQLLPDTDTATLNRFSIAFTILEVGLVFFQLSFNYDKLWEQHRTSAKNMLVVKNRLLVAMSAPLARKELDSFVDEINQLYLDAPQTGWLAKFLANHP